MSPDEVVHRGSFYERALANKMQFADRNFRLACIDAIHCAGHLPHVFNETVSGQVADRLASLDSIVLTDEMLRKITRLAADGGDSVYLFADPEWGAENDELYISRFDDIVLLSRLESLWVHAVTSEGALDLSLLLECPSLRSVSANSFYVMPSRHNLEIVAKLESRGVNVCID